MSLCDCTADQLSRFTQNRSLTLNKGLLQLKPEGPRDTGAPNGIDHIVVELTVSLTRLESVSFVLLMFTLPTTNLMSDTYLVHFQEIFAKRVHRDSN